MAANNVSPEFEAELKRLGIYQEMNEEKMQEKGDENDVKTVRKSHGKRGRKSTSARQKMTVSGERASFVTVSLNSDVVAAIRRYHSAYCLIEGKVSMGDFLLDAVRLYVSKECRKAEEIVSSLED